MHCAGSMGSQAAGLAGSTPWPAQPSSAGTTQDSGGESLPSGLLNAAAVHSDEATEAASSAATAGARRTARCGVRNVGPNPVHGFTAGSAALIAAAAALHSS